jgi:lysophospholipase L1-like esterase
MRKCLGCALYIRCALSPEKYGIYVSSLGDCDKIKKNSKLPTKANGAVTTSAKIKASSYVPSLDDCDKIKKNSKSTENNLNNNDRHNIIILGDSHVRGWAENMKDNLDENYSVTGMVNPGASITTLNDSLKDTSTTLKKKDIIVFCGGSNDVARNQSRKGLRYIANFVRKCAHTNVVLLSVPHRHDLADWSCVNNEINTFNRKMLKMTKCYNHVTVLNSEQNREHFTRHGMHLNKKGKAEIAKRIIEACKQIIQPKENMFPISLSWKETGNHKINLHMDNYRDINNQSASVKSTVAAKVAASKTTSKTIEKGDSSKITSPVSVAATTEEAEISQTANVATSQTGTEINPIRKSHRIKIAVSEFKSDFLW